MTQKFDIVVIGGGPAGITLAKRLGETFSMLVIRPEEHSMIYCAMPYVIENLIDIHKCYKKDEVTTDSGAKLLKDTVSKIDFNNKTVILSHSPSVQYNKLVIATGASPFIPQIEGAHLEGVLGFKTQKDLEHIHHYIDSGITKAVVVGAGAIGIELAQALRHKKLDVSLVDMASHILPNLVDSDLAEKVKEELTKNNISLHLNSRVEKLQGTDYVSEIHLDTHEKISLENNTTGDTSTPRGIVVFATGVVPELALIPEHTLKIGKQGIIVNERMETTIEDVYAVGDCVQYKHFITQKIAPGKLATNAVPMARILAHNLLGKKAEYKGFINGAATKVYNIFVGGTGLTSEIASCENFHIIKGHSQVTTQFPIMPHTKPLSVTLLADANTTKIIGGQVLSGEPVTSLIDLISFAIQKQATIYDIYDLSYSSQPYQSFFPAGNALVMAAEKIIVQLEQE
ncbi:MAG: FAD-dependent oxidoreductase [Bacteroidales bacterium]